MNAVQKIATEKRVKIALAVLCLVVYTQTMTSALIAYIMNSYADIPATTVQQLLTLPGLIGLFVSFLIGPLSMKVNKKYLLAFTSLCVLAYFLIFFFIGGNGPFVMLIVAAALMGINQGSARTLTTSIIADFIEPTKQAAFVAFTTALMNVGGVLFNLVGGRIAAGNGGANWPNAYLLGLLLVPALLIYLWLMPKSPEAAEKDSKQAEITEASGTIPVKAILATLLNTLFAISVCAFMYNYSVYVITTYALGTSVETGIANSIYLTTGLVGLVYPVFMKAFKRYIAPVGYGLFAVGMLLMVLVHSSIYVVYFSVLLIGLGFNIGNPFVSAYVMRITPKKWVPMAVSILFGGVNLGMYFSTYILKALGSLFGGGVLAAFIVGCIGGVVSAILAVFLYSMDPATKVVVAEKSAK